MFRFRHNTLLGGAAIALSLCIPAMAQVPYRPVPGLVEGDRAEQSRTEEARRRAAAEDLRRLNEKMDAFVRAWNDFTQEYSERGTFNLRKARAMTKAWRSLEREETWPKK